MPKDGTYKNGNNGDGYLAGQLLIATPMLSESLFRHAVIFMCAHNDEGAMGMMINHVIDNISYGELFDQLSINNAGCHHADMPVYYGGPVEMNRGFVIYDNEGKTADSPPALDFGDISVSSSMDTLRAIARDGCPKKTILTLGYAGWAPGQLEAEIEENSWISVPADISLIFDTADEEKWEYAALRHGIDITKFHSLHAGHA